MATIAAAIPQVIGKCSNGHVVRGENRLGEIVATTPGASTDRYRNLVCECGASAGYRYMTITIKPDMTCSAKCTGATGPVCSCSCGGENHAGGHVFNA